VLVLVNKFELESIRRFADNSISYALFDNTYVIFNPLYISSTNEPTTPNGPSLVVTNTDYISGNA
jgi:hypothetical protein